MADYFLYNLMFPFTSALNNGPADNLLVFIGVTSVAETGNLTSLPKGIHKPVIEVVYSVLPGFSGQVKVWSQ